MRLLTILFRCLSLRCPRCGRGRQFRGWFSMFEQCDHCGLVYQKGPGYFLGSIYFNYGVTALIVTAAYFTFHFATEVSPEAVLAGLTAFCFLFPLWFFRYARSLWLGLDETFDPPRDDQGERRSPATLESRPHP